MLINEKNYVEMAEQVIKPLSEKKTASGKSVPMVTTSKLRNLLAMVSDTYNDVLNLKEDKLTEELVGQINYMKIRFYYEAGREPKVKELLDHAKVFSLLDQIGGSRANYILFSRYMEALVAFRKYYGGKDE